MSTDIKRMDKIEVFESYEYVYLLQTPELRNTKIFKFGKTTNLMTRYKGYPQDTVIYFVCRVSNCHHVENEILRLFKLQFIPAKTCGREYYKGDLKSMIKTINQIIDDLHVKVDDDEEMGKFLKRCYKSYIKIRIGDKAIDDYTKQQGDIDNLEINNDGDTIDSLIDNDINDDLSNISDDIESDNSDIEEEEIDEKIKPKREHIFVCDECDKEFTAKHNLRNHVVKKLCKITNYFCKYCEKGFTSETNMYRHMRTICKIKIERDEEAEQQEEEKLRERLKLLEKINKKLEKNTKLIELNLKAKQKIKVIKSTK